MARVFISHSSRDAQAALWISEWLHQNGYDAPFLDFDKHIGIPPGADWERTLYREIASSQAIIIVLSDHWNASKWGLLKNVSLAWVKRSSGPGVRADQNLGYAATSNLVVSIWHMCLSAAKSGPRRRQRSIHA